MLSKVIPPPYIRSNPELKISFFLSFSLCLVFTTRIFNALLSVNFDFTYFFVTGEPRFHKPSGFFWAPLPTYNSYMYPCIVIYFG